MNIETAPREGGRIRTIKQTAALTVDASSRSATTIANLQTTLLLLSHNWNTYSEQMMLLVIARRCIAYLGCTYQERSRIRCSPNFSVTSAGDIAKRRRMRTSDREGIGPRTSR